MLDKSASPNFQEPILTAPPEIRTAIERILLLERNKLYQKKNRNINEDVLKIIKEQIQ